MSRLDEALEVSSLTRIIVDMQEKKKRLQTLNHYDHEETGTSNSQQPFFIEVGGGSTHIRYFPKNNDIGNIITLCLLGVFADIETEAEQRLAELLI